MVISVNLTLSVKSTATDALAIVAWETGRIVDVFYDPHSNLIFHEAGVSKAERELESFIAGVAKGVGLDPAEFTNRIKRACFGLAGTRTALDEETVRGMVRLGSRSQLFITTELDGTLIANSSESTGIVVNVGSGTMVIWRVDGGSSGCAGGWGPELGDSGGEFWIGRRALRLLMRAYDGLEPMPDVLRERILAGTLAGTLGFAQHDLSYLLSWMDKVMQFDIRRQVSRLAKYVESAAEDGEMVAQAIIAAAVDHICDILCRTADVSGINASSYCGPVILEGEFIESNKIMASAVRSVAKFLFPNAHVIYPRYDGVVGLHMYALAGDERVSPSIRQETEEKISELSRESRRWLLLRGQQDTIVQNHDWPWQILPYWMDSISRGRRPEGHRNREMP